MPNDAVNINRNKFHQLLVEYFNLEELKTLCFDMQLDYEELPGETKARKVGELIEYCERHGLVAKLIEVVKEVRKNVDWQGITRSITPYFSSFPFTNREDEIREILSSFAPAYTLLDAPAGYGKTELLRELERRFKEREWRCAYASIGFGKANTLATLAQDLAKDLAVDFSPDKKSNMPWGLQLGGALTTQWRDDPNQKTGIVLLIDLEKRPSLTILQELLDHFIPQMEECLRVEDAFARKHNRFRVVLAGRYLAIRPEVNNASLRLSIRQLSPFDYKVIRDSTKNYLPQAAEKVIHQLAAYLFSTTGGHPGCMAQVLEKYKSSGLAVKPFTNYFSEEIWDLIGEYTDDIHYDIYKNTNAVQVIDRLSVFRYLDYTILKQMLRTNLIVTRDEVDLADQLTSTFLLGWKGPFLQDGITRRLLASQLRYKSPDDFSKYCQQAQNLCEDRLQQPNIQGPERWVIEYLFQSLQKYATEIHHVNGRKNIRELFWVQIVPSSLQMFTDNYITNYPQVAKNVLKQTLEEDWEFQFTVNYYLREDEYSEQQYRQLLYEIDRFFK